jgi:hypothetical protein
MKTGFGFIAVPLHAELGRAEMAGRTQRLMRD